VEGLAPHFQIVLTRDGRMDVMTIRTEALPEAADDAARSAMADRLEKLIKDNVGISTEVVVGEPGAVPRSQGKAVRIIDERPKEG